MDPNLEAILKTLSDQMAHITTRLDRLGAREPRRTHEAHIEVDPKPEAETPIDLGELTMNHLMSQTLGGPTMTESMI